MLALFVAIIIAYLLRSTLLRHKVQQACGSFDLANELGHGFCAVLMVPMVVSNLMMDSDVRFVSSLLCLAGTIFFLGRYLLVHVLRIVTLEKNDWWWDPAHAGMFGGMAIMYFVHDHTIWNAEATKILLWVVAAFYVSFTAYYVVEVIEDIRESNSQKRLFYIQADLSHVVIGLAMFLMTLFPATFMAMG